MIPNIQNSAEKPYNVCIECPHIGRDCDGPNFLAMSTERWCEWCHLRKDFLGWTNAYTADMADVSEISVARIMSGNVKDLRVTTMQAVTKALVNGSWGQYPCAMVSEESPALADKCRQLQETLDNIQNEHRAELSAMRDYDEKRLDYLKEQVKFHENESQAKDKMLAERDGKITVRNRAIFILSLLLGITIAVIVTALVVDYLNRGIGFFWIDQLFHGKIDLTGFDHPSM